MVPYPSGCLPLLEWSKRELTPSMSIEEVLFSYLLPLVSNWEGTIGTKESHPALLVHDRNNTADCHCP